MEASSNAWDGSAFLFNAESVHLLGFPVLADRGDLHGRGSSPDLAARPKGKKHSSPVA